jgi:hypothetical protein
MGAIRSLVFRHRFVDGSEISSVDRDDFVFRRSDGAHVSVHAFVNGPSLPYSRVLDLWRLDRWVGGTGRPVTDEEKMEILKKFSRYRWFAWSRVGVSFKRDGPIISIREATLPGKL